jgi:peroxiredoxin
MTTKTRIVVIAVIVFLGILGYGYLTGNTSTTEAVHQSEQNKDDGAVKEQEKFEAPDFTLKNIEGVEIRLSDLKGKIVFINFWATWCGPCRQEIPAFVELQEEYGVDDLAILGISVDQGDLSVVPKFAESYNINYEILYANADVVRTYGGINSIPTTFVVDRDGYLRDRMVGFPGKEYFVRVIEFLM